MLRFVVFCLIGVFLTAARAEKLIIEPEAGRAPLLAAILKAKSSVSLVMYGLTDESFIKALIAEKNKDIAVNVLLEAHPYKADTENQLAIQQLRTAAVNLHYPNHAYKLTHQKTFLLDEQTAIVMTFNLTHSTFKNERNFALIIDDPAMVKEINTVFLADWEHKDSVVTNPNLVWSPNNARKKIVNFIQSAHQEIKIYAQDISDYQVIGLLAKAARSGKKIEILLSSFHETKNRKYDFMRKAGIKLRFSKKMLIHAKVIMVDRHRALLGSINLTRPSINANRELAVITQDPTTIHQLLETFQTDWGKVNSHTRVKSWDMARLLIREMRHIAKQLTKAKKEGFYDTY